MRRIQEFGWALVIAALISAITVESQSTTLSFGSSYTILDTTSTGAVTGEAFALPGGAAAVVGFAHVNETAPSAVTVTFQVSNDGTNWTSLVNSTGTSASPSIAGLNNTGVIAWRFIRATQTSRTGGSRTTVTASVARAFQTNSPNSVSSGLLMNGPIYFGGQTATNGMLRAGDTGQQQQVWMRLGNDSSYGTFKAGTFLMGQGSNITDSSNGIITLYNGSQNDFGRLNFGGNTSSFPTIKRSSNTLEFKLADDSGYNTTVADRVVGLTTLQAGASASTATTGSVRLPHASSVIGRNQANSADNTIVSYGVLANNELSIGNGNSTTRINTILTTPTALANGHWWVDCLGTSPSRVCAIKVQDGGATRTIGSMTY